MPENEKALSETALPTVKKRKKYPKTTKKGTKDFTSQEKAMIIERTKQVGINQAADEYGTSWQAIAAMQREAKAIGNLSPKPDKAITKQIEVIEPKAKPSAEEITFAKTVDAPKQNIPLELENAILRERIDELTEQLERLRGAVSQLL